MACGRTEYKRLKEKKEYKDMILLLKGNNMVFWTYEEDAVKLINGLIGDEAIKNPSGRSFHCSEEQIQSKYSIRHLVGDIYEAVLRTQLEKANPQTRKEFSPNPIPVYTPEPPVEASCDICLLRINEECTLVKPSLCESYRAAPPATREEKEGRRIMGDASGIAQRIPYYKR